FDEREPTPVHSEPTNGTLYIADNENNQVWSWTEAAGLRKAWTLPDPDGALAAKATLVGQIVRLADGTFVVMRFGQPGGGHGGIVFVSPQSKREGVVPNLDPRRKRLGMAQAPDGRLFGSYFVGMGGGRQAGAVTLIDLQKGESDFATGFQKITGLLVVGDSLIVADQLADTIYELPLNGPLPAPGSYKVLARLPRPDQMAPGPDGSIFTGQFQGAPDSRTALAVRQVLRDGTVRLIAADPDVTRPSGLAYDAAGRRLFVANGGNPAQTFVRVFTLP
ncbi:MAG: SMP-30/gluconolactonase/LRE family protein, partial [Vicinamibacterales bacterium]